MDLAAVKGVVGLPVLSSGVSLDTSPFSVFPRGLTDPFGAEPSS